MATNKEVLEVIKKNTEDLAKNHLTFASTVSIFINEQNDFNSEQKVINNKMSGYLENDAKTDSKGAINRIGDLESDVKDMKNFRKVIFGVATVFGLIGGFMLKAFGYFNR